MFCQPGRICPLPPSSCQSCPSTRGRGWPAGRASCPGCQPGACAPTHPPSSRLFQHQQEEKHLHRGTISGWVGWTSGSGRLVESWRMEMVIARKSRLGMLRANCVGNSPPPFEHDFAAFSSDHETCTIVQLSSSTR